METKIEAAQEPQQPRYFGQGAPQKKLDNGNSMDRHILVGHVVQYDKTRGAGFISATPPIVHQGREQRFYFPAVHFLNDSGNASYPDIAIGTVVEFELAHPLRWGEIPSAAINVRKLAPPPPEPPPPLPLTRLERLLRWLHLIPVRSC